MSEQIDQFFRPDGTLISIPIPFIAKYHADTAALRRYMIEYGILERDGESVYWVSVNS
jgi:hypothetical protein